MTIVAIGTSLTAPASTWFTRTGDWLQSQYPGKVTIVREAISSTASKYTDTYKSPGSGLDVQLPKALAHNPDAIFIEFAINDAYTPYGISPQASKENLQAMIAKINTWAANNHKKVDIVVQTMNNVLDGSEAAMKRPDLASYYEGCREVVAANPKVLLIDTNRNWVNLYNSQTDHARWKRLVSDGIHPNDTGAAQVIVPEIQRSLTNQMPEPTTLHSTGDWTTESVGLCLTETQVAANSPLSQREEDRVSPHPISNGRGGGESISQTPLIETK